MLNVLALSKIWDRYRAYVLLLGVSLILLVAELFQLLTPIKDMAHYLIRPMLQFNIRLGQNLIQPAQRLKKMYKAAYRIQDLEREVAQSQAKLSQMQLLKEENQTLKQILENADRDLEAVAVAAPLLSWSKPAVAAGQESGIEVNDSVLVENTMVGRIGQVKMSHSYVDLLKEEATQAVLAETESGVQGLVRGDGRRVLLTEIPNQAEVRVGERVTTLGQEGLEPGIYIGKIASIQSGHSDAVKVAVVEQFVSFYEAVIVEIK